MSCSLLVVDDDPAILQGVKRLLEQEGYTVNAASTGTQALSCIAGSSLPALIILDVVLPDLDGYTICRSVRQLAVHVPVLMLSARDDCVDKVLGLDLGADDYLTKPFEPRELLARVRALLRFKASITGTSSVEQPLVAGPLAMWPGAHRVEIHGQAIELPPKEWALLECFLNHPDTVFGRETLLRRIWGYDFVGESRTVDVHVQRLRARLELYTDISYIQTVRGFGYRFAVAGSPTT